MLQASWHYWAGAVLDVIVLTTRRDYNRKIYCETPAQYGRRYIL